VAGLDEVGRGAWAGPVSVGVAVIRPSLRRSSLPRWLRDSKLLAEERREAVFGEIANWCADGAVGHASAAECDRWGMTAALRLAAFRALAQLELVPDALLIDGPYDLLRAPPPTAHQQTLELDLGPDEFDPDGGGDPYARPEGLDGSGWGRVGAVPGAAPRPDPGPLLLPDVAPPARVQPVVDGDARCASVAAASVLAKVVRDRMMRAEAIHYPAYHFESNKGYPSPLHKIALRGYGLSAIHRRSWAFTSNLPWASGRRDRGWGHPDAHRSDPRTSDSAFR